MNLIVSQGPENADIMFIMDSATEEDSKAGTAFSGNYTNDIKSLCKKAGISYNTTYRTLLLKEKLSYGGRNKKQKREAIAAAHSHYDYKEILTNEIKGVKPKIIVPLGELAFRFVTGEESITKFRGSILPVEPILSSKIDNSFVRVIPTFGHEHLMYNNRNRVIALLDYRKIAQRVQLEPFVDNTLVWIADTPERFQNYLKRFPVEDFGWGVFDIETRYNFPVCIGFCFSPVEAICVPLLDNSLSKSNQVLLWQMVDIELRKREWVNQNIKFDLNILERRGFRVPKIKGDTSIRAANIYPELPKNLGFLNSIYTDMPYFKDEGKDVTDVKKLYLYCAKDCLSTYQVYVKQEEEIRDLGLEEFMENQHKVFWPYVKLERRGILIDQEKRDRLLSKYVTEYNIHKGALKRIVGRDINPQSPKQIADLLYKELQFPQRINRTTGALCTDEETIEEFLVFHCTGEGNYSVLTLIEACRKFHKVIEALVSPIHPDLRLRCSYSLGGAVTGRTTTSKTTDYSITRDNKGKWVLEETGRPFQNIGKHGFKVGDKTYGKDLRSIFVPTPGYVLCELDLSQAESRVDCVLAKDYDFLALYDSGPGIHRTTASWVYSCEPMEIDKKSDKYFIGKTVRHAGERNMGGDRLAKMIREPMEFCKDLLDKFHNTQPNIRKVFHREVTEFVRANRFLVSPHGHRRDFFGKPDHDMDMEAISQIPQATVGKQIQFSLPLLNEAVPYAHFLYEGHDALMCEIKKDQLEDYEAKARPIVERPINFRKCSIARDFDLVIPAEFSWSDTTWQDMKDLK